MAKHRPKRRPPRRSGPTTDRRRRQTTDEPDLVAQIQQLLAEPHPLPFLEFATSFANLLDADDGRLAAETGIDAATLVATFIEAGDPALDALLLALHAYLPSRVPAPVRQATGTTAPAWLARLADARATRAIVIDDVLGDANTLAVEVRLADGNVFCMLALVDHNMGTILKDAFALDLPMREVIAEFADVAEPGSSTRELPLADAAMLIQEAADEAALLPDAPETETWPMIGPLLHWVVRLLPRGGSGWPHHQVTDQEIERLVREIIADRRIAWGPDAEDVVETLLRFAAVTTPGDPLRWSPVTVDVLFTAWLDEHGLMERVWMDQVPPAVEAVVRFAHRRRGVPEVSTRDTLEALSHWSLAGGAEPPRRRSALHRLVAGGDLDLLTNPTRLQLALLEADAGGAEALERIDARPLPSEPLDLAAVPPDIAGRVRSIAEDITAVLDRYFDDPELSTAAVRLLTRVASADPTPFRRRSDDAMLAAAVAWMAAKANDAFGGPRTVKGLTAAFGRTGSAAQRAKGLLDSIDRTWEGAWSKDLGDPALLTSRRRGAMIAERDRLRAVAREAGGPPPLR